METGELADRAARIVLAVHQSMNWDVWGTKRLKYWSILTDNVRSAAYTNSLPRFINSLCSKMQIASLGRNRGQRSELDGLLSALPPEDERRLLRLFREEATTLVLQTRVWIEERRVEPVVEPDTEPEIETSVLSESEEGDGYGLSI